MALPAPTDVLFLGNTDEAPDFFEQGKIDPAPGLPASSSAHCLRISPRRCRDMAGKRRPSTPSDLKERGRALWRQIVADHDLDAPGLEVLREACRVADLCDDLRETIDVAGLIDRGSREQERISPAVGELRRQQHLLAQLLAQLDLEDGRVESTTTVRARKAARSRWGRLRVVESSAPRVSRYEHLKTQPRPPA